jgi:predicted PurR-regulated permease PerM
MPADPTPSPVRMRWIRLRRKTAFETALIAGGLLLFLALLYQMQEFLSPPVVAAAGILLLWPLREQRTVQALLLAGGFLLVFWFLDKLSSVLLPFVVVYLLAYLFDPVVSLLQARYRVPRWASSLGATLLVVGLVVLFIFLLVPSIVSQLETLAGRILDSAGELRTWILTTPLLDELESTGLIDKEQLIAQLNAFVQEKATELANGIPNAAQTLVESIGSLVGVITILSIIPVVLSGITRSSRTGSSACFPPSAGVATTWSRPAASWATTCAGSSSSAPSAPSTCLWPCSCSSFHSRCSSGSSRDCST